MRQGKGRRLEQPRPAPELDPDLFEERLDTRLQERFDCHPDDVEPWQLLGDLLEEITGEADAD
jgi:cytochrome c-type biogenesis protein CcmH/NrfG